MIAEQVMKRFIPNENLRSKTQFYNKIEQSHTSSLNVLLY